MHALTLQIVAADLCLVLRTLVLTCRHVRRALRLTRSTTTRRPGSDARILLHAVHHLLLRAGIRCGLVAHQSILHIATAIVMQSVGAAAVVLNLSSLAQLLLRLRIVLRLLLVVLRLRQKGKVLRTQRVVAARIRTCLTRRTTHCFVLLVKTL